MQVARFTFICGLGFAAASKGFFLSVADRTAQHGLHFLVTFLEMRTVQSVQYSMRYPWRGYCVAVSNWAHLHLALGTPHDEPRVLPFLWNLMVRTKFTPLGSSLILDFNIYRALTSPSSSATASLLYLAAITTPSCKPRETPPNQQQVSKVHIMSGESTPKGWTEHEVVCLRRYPRIAECAMLTTTSLYTSSAS
jgi:hypothetical protein